MDVTSDRSSELGVTWIVDASDTDGGAGATSFNGATSLGRCAAGGCRGRRRYGSTALGLLPDGLTYAVGRFKDTGTNWAPC